MARNERSILARLLRSPAIAAIFVVAASLRLFWIVYVLRPPNVQLDFSPFWLGAWAMRHGVNPYQYDLTRAALHFNVVIGPLRRANYPPTFFLLFYPLSHLTPWHAYWVWCAISVVVLIASLYLLVAAKKIVPPPTAMIFMALGVMYLPIQIHFEFMQVQLLVLFLLILMWRALARDNDLGAGAALAIAGLLKAYPLFMALYLICARKWRALGFTILALAIGFGLTVAVVGSQAFWFFDTIGPHVNPKPGYPFIPFVGMAGSIVRISQHFVPDDSNHALLVVRRIAELISEVAVLALTIAAILRAQTDRRRDEYAFGLCIVAMVLCDSNSWPHYMVFMLMPLSQIAIATDLGIAPAIAPALAVISYVLTEVSYRLNHWRVEQLNLEAPSWFGEGLFLATLIVFAAAYVLATRAAEEHRTIEGDQEMPTNAR